MFIGHFGLAFAAKRAAPRASLWLLFAAAQFADLLWPLLVAAGLEQVRIDQGNTAFTPLDFVSYPYSHSFVLLIAWGAALAWLARVLGSDARTSAVLFLLVVSHWVLDVLMHRPDLPVYPGSAEYGLGLWNSIPATLVIEFALFAVGLWVYAQATKARDGTGRWALIALAALLALVYLAASSTPPPSVTAVWAGATGGAAVILAFSVWVDRHRAAR